jgi:hypothetical protein
MCVQPVPVTSPFPISAITISTIPHFQVPTPTNAMGVQDRKGMIVCLCLYEVLSVLWETSQTVIAETASVKDDERGGQGHTSTNLLHQSAM